MEKHYTFWVHSREMRPDKTNPATIEKALRLLQENGYFVKKQIQYTKKTFEVSIQTLEQVRQVQEVLGYKLKDVVEEAFTQWLELKNQDYAKALKGRK